MLTPLVSGEREKRLPNSANGEAESLGSRHSSFTLAWCDYLAIMWWLARISCSIKNELSVDVSANGDRREQRRERKELCFLCNNKDYMHKYRT
jgi:hypothetical protein